MTKTPKPTIGIILDWEGDGSFSNFPYYALRSHYIDAVRLAGGTPWLIPYGKDTDAMDYLGKIDGLLIPGGCYAMPDDWYEDKKTTSPYAETPRFKFEETIIKQALAIDMPILGICAGMQMLAGIFNCKLTSKITSDINHWDFNQDHDINIEEDSLLQKICGSKTISTNSHHQEAIISVTEHIKISARCSDGTIEAIEVIDNKFALGLQWHPEMLCFQEHQTKNRNPHHLLFMEFINASQTN